tara:strand:+ start:710 stop:1189 length:480 start_codon:yes stop_codon:yes gene_type:complete
MNLKQTQDNLEIKTTGEGLTDITPLINKWLKETGFIYGVIHLMVLHTSCSLTINENADPRVLEDLSQYFRAIVPEEGLNSLKEPFQNIKYKHSEEGLDDMPAHIKTSLTNTCLSLSIKDSKVILGTWQAVYLWEHRYQNNLRRINIHGIGQISSHRHSI